MTPGVRARYPPYAHALAGAGGGLTSVVLLHPLDTLRTRLQATASPGTSRRARGARETLRRLGTLVSMRAAPTLYRGAVPASLGSVLSWACYFHSFQRASAAVSPVVPNATAAHLLSGTVAGVLTSVATNPIWVVKVRLQLQSGAPVPTPPHGLPTAAAAPPRVWRPYAGMADGLLTIAREEGLRGLYRGLVPSLWLVSHGALQFTLYERFKAGLLRARAEAENGDAGASSSTTSGTNGGTHRAPSVGVRDALLASTGSKLVASLLTYPIQVARTRMQTRAADGTRYGALHRALVHIFRSEGVRGLYRGISANVLRVTPQAAVTFITYEQILRACENPSYNNE